MRKDPLVSIIISSYNYGHFLRDAIDSAIAQTYPTVEVIVVDDGSVDDSPAVIREYRDRITPILKENGGQASAFNAGFAISSGEVIIFLDSDDMLLPTAVEKAVACFTNDKMAKVHWPLWKIDASGNKTGDVDPKYPLAEGDLFDEVVQYGPNHCGGPPYSPNTSGIAWSRKFLEQVFPIPEAGFKTCTDQYLFVLAPIYGHLRSVAEPQGYYRVHGSNYSLNPLDEYLKESLLRFEQSCEIVSNHLKKKGIIVNPATWARDTWYHQIHTTIQEITDVVPSQASFILADEGQLGTSHIHAGRYRIPFIEQNGQYWGPPANDTQAIEEIERQRTKGSAYIFFAWPTFWWLEHYSGMYNYLMSNYTCLINNERLVGFKLEKV
ncbi:hypothetical protein GCM10023189_16560 [Nibrella saemangeumensis]|uniref:Glycosyltransferase 2-like domain-containing protein n=1 Tax=Nibrella saemangeumensis TaxID=1084526 RepID=A0ABP8MMD6_9BACT